MAALWQTIISPHPAVSLGWGVEQIFQPYKFSLKIPHLKHFLKKTQILNKLSKQPGRTGHSSYPCTSRQFSYFIVMLYQVTSILW